MNLSLLSIRRKLALAILIGVLFSSVMIGLISQISSKNMISNRLVEVELPNILWQIRNQVDKEISVLQNATEQLSSNALISRWIENGAPKEGEADVVKTLINVQKQYGLTNSSIADRKTAKYWNQDGFLRVLQNDKFDSWFFAFRDSGNAVSKSLYVEKGVTKLFINFQQLDGRVLAGVGRSMDQMVDVLNDFKIADTGFVFITDAAGKIQIHRNKERLGKRLSEIYGADTQQHLLGRQAFALEEVTVDGEAVYLASSYIESADWYIVARVPASEIFAELNANSLRMILWTIVLAGLFTVIALWLAQRLTAPITHLAEVFADLGKAEANLDVRLERQSSTELQALQEGFNAFVSKIQATVERVSNTSELLRNNAGEVAQSAKDFLHHGQQQSTHTEQVATAVTQMGNTVHEVAGNATQAADTANELELSSSQGKEVSIKAKKSIELLSHHVDDVGAVINKLASHTQAIGGVLEVIRGVSEQTNLLALNAAIEAARAGEMGRGFAVVADEVRSLAQRTAESTDEIQTTITELQKETQTAVSLMVESKSHASRGVEAVIEAESALVNIADGIVHLKDINNQVAAATEEQAVVAKDISFSLEQIREDTLVNLRASDDVAKASVNLQALSEQLDKLVAAYRSS
ncbi:methyl-accepting chemotaxis protein [Alteromonas sp. a30]|uniref:methyl-accepting chemotaxis protein n=1 Tax=Alteromonas sp. a30 TaxID=2730917 RepID=UPI00228013F3|nr:methyl-accepting chemotaxis protein [Alteromonas sp. a30]MCY7296072.1 methyl-accepting chemotaxis protein [Alteromonas sp. a30]